MITDKNLFQFEFIVNTDYDLYRNRGTSVKVSVFIPARGVFWVLCEKGGTTQRGRRYSNKTNPILENSKLMHGNGHGVYLDGKIFTEWDGLEDWQRDCVAKCVKSLRSALWMYRDGDRDTQEHTALTTDQSASILASIMDLEKIGVTPTPPVSLEEKCTETTVSASEENTVTAIFTPVDVASLEEDVLTAIQNGISSRNGNVNGMTVSYGGKEYQLRQEGKELVLYSRESVGQDGQDEISAGKPVTSNERTRKTTPVLVIDDDEGLTEFVKGEFYPVLDKTETFNGSMYYSVTNADGEQRYISSKRAHIVDVFAESPIDDKQEKEVGAFPPIF